MIKIQERPTESTNNEKLLDVTRDINFFFISVLLLPIVRLVTCYFKFQNCS